MNQEKLESLNPDDLPYPMFKTSWYEKRLLRKALKKNEPYLCHRLYKMYLPTCFLVRKISKSLGGLASLEGYFYFSHKRIGLTNSIKVRDTWIRKLLEYKGE